MRYVFGIFTGLVTAALILVMAQMIREGMYPKPYDFSSDQIGKMNAWIATWQRNAFIVVTIGHGLAAFAAGLISSLTVGQSRMSAGIISICIVFIPVMVYLFTYSFPVWFVVTDTVVTAILGFVSVTIGSSRVSDY